MGVGEVVVNEVSFKSDTTACSSDVFQPFTLFRRDKDAELVTRLMAGESDGLLSLDVFKVDGSEDGSSSELLLDEPRLDDGLESLTPNELKNPSVSSKNIEKLKSLLWINEPSLQSKKTSTLI